MPALYTWPGCVAVGGAPAPIENCFCVCYSPAALMNASPVGYQSREMRGPIPGVTAASAGVPVYVRTPLREILTIWSGLEGY